MCNDGDHIGRMVNIIKNSSGLDVEVGHFGGIVGAEFCKLNFDYDTSGELFAYMLPGNILRKIGIKITDNLDVVSKKAYSYLKSRVYSALAANYKLPIGKVLELFLLPGDKRPTFDVCLKEFESDPDNDYKIANLQEYTDAQSERYYQIFGDEIEDLCMHFESVIQTRAEQYMSEHPKGKNLSQSDYDLRVHMYSMSFTYHAADFPKIFENELKSKNKVKNAVKVDIKATYSSTYTSEFVAGHDEEEEEHEVSNDSVQ